MSDEIKVSDRTKVIFQMPDGSEIECAIRKGRLRVEGSSKLVVRPEATNVVSVSVE